MNAKKENRGTFGQNVSPIPSLEVLVAAARDHGACTDLGTLKVPGSETSNHTNKPHGTTGHEGGIHAN
jgi:hypothetical protein